MIIECVLCEPFVPSASKMLTKQQQDEWVNFLLSDPTEEEMTEKIEALPEDEQEEVGDLLFAIFLPRV